MFTICCKENREYTAQSDKYCAHENIGCMRAETTFVLPAACSGHWVLMSICGLNVRAQKMTWKNKHHIVIKGCFSWGWEADWRAVDDLYFLFAAFLMFHSVLLDCTHIYLSFSLAPKVLVPQQPASACPCC